MGGAINACGDKFLKMFTILSKDSECSIASAYQLTRLFYQGGQEFRKVSIGFNLND